MPLAEFDFDDPLELNGVALRTDEDTTAAMSECFIEEFLRLGYQAGQLLDLFRQPQYLGPHLVWQRRGETFVRRQISQVFRHWGRPADFP